MKPKPRFEEKKKMRLEGLWKRGGTPKDWVEKGRFGEGESRNGRPDGRVSRGPQRKKKSIGPGEVSGRVKGES